VVAVNEAAQALDLFSGAIDFSNVIAESAAGSDRMSSLPIYGVTVAELVRARDTVLGKFLWDIINDSQTVTWNTINAQGGSVWVVINNSEVTDWQTIKTLN
jgi:hypothetical protein